jgi:uncharacterized repeat protein (TIGR01451 family)
VAVSTTAHASSPHTQRWRAPRIAVCAIVALLLAQPAFAALTIAKNSWNVIGLDSNDVTTGPNVFPVAVTICNTGPSAVTNLTTTFVWDSSNSLINLTGPATVNRGTLAAGACVSAYYWVAITRSPSVYATARRYHITVTADGGLSASTPVREVFVERLISQNRNTSNTPSGPTTVVVGQTYTYTWTAATAPQGYEQVENFVTFGDSIFRVLSAQSSYSSGPSPVGGMYNNACNWNDDPASGGYRTCAGGGKAGGNITMTVTVLVVATGPTSLAGAIYDFSGSSYHYNSDFGNNVLRVTAIAATADVSIAKTDGIASVTAGGTTTYTIAVSNAGPSAADGAIVRDPAVAGLSKTTVSCSAAGGAVCPGTVTVAGLESSLTIPTLPSGGTVTFTVTAQVTAANGSITNSAIVTPPASVTDPNSANNTASDTDTIATTPAATQADLTVTKTDGVSTLVLGSTTLYTVIVTNNGPNAVTGATLTDTAPAGVTFGAWTCTGAGGATCPASGSGNVSASVTLPVGGTVTFQITATVGNNASGNITNTASIALPAGTTDPNPANNTASDTDTITTTSVATQADLAITKTDGVSTLTPGGATTYTVVVTNNGPAAVTGATVTDTAPEGVTFGGWTCTGTAGGVCPSSGSGHLNATVTLPSGSSVTFSINANVKPDAAGSVTNTATVTLPAGVGDPNPANNVATDTDTIPTFAPAPRPPDTPGDTPPPQQSPALTIAKAASLEIAEIGDAIAYSIHIRSDGAAGLPAMRVEDRLPLGFAYVPGSASLSVGATTVRVDDPSGAATRSLVFAIPVQPAAEATLTYRVRLSAGAFQGDGRNCVRAVAADGVTSNTSCARVLVTSGVFTQQACVMGRVFLDVSGNRIQDPAEPGVPGVVLFLEDGTSLRTDSAGGFSYCGVRAGTHVLKVDMATVPAGARLVEAGTRNGLDARSAFLDVKFGEVHRTDVILSGDARVLAEINRRRTSAETLSPETAPLIPGAASELVRSETAAPGPPRGVAGGTSPQDPILAVGVVEGIVSLSSLRRSAVTNRPGDVFDEELRRYSRSFDGGKGVAAGRAALFLQGSVSRDYRVSVSFDSERPDRGALFRDIQPDAFYPIYGDASQKLFYAQTSRRAYAKVERGRSYILYGDLMTMTRETPARDLGTYARALTGVQHRLERRNAVVNVFATRDTLRRVIDEVGGRGISGPYGVSNPNGVSGTENVEIITRDRNQPSVILSTQPLVRFLDYEFEPFSGRVLFRRPIPSMDESLNPVSIRITYEVDGGGQRHWVDGVDGQIRIGRRVELGGSWAQDRNPLAPYELASANTAVTLGKRTTLIAEAARSVATLNTNVFNRVFTPNLADLAGEAEGHAARVEVAVTTQDLQVRAYAGTSDAAFYNPSATLNGGRTEAGVRLSYLVAGTSRVRGELIRSGDRVTGGTRQGGYAGIEATRKRFTFEAGVRHMKETTPAEGSPAGTGQPFGTTLTSGFGFSQAASQIDPVSGLPIVTLGTPSELSAVRLAPFGQPLDATTFRVRVSSSFATDWKAFAEGEQDVTGADRRMAAIGGEYRAADRARLYVRHELSSNPGGLYSLREGPRTQRTVFGASSTYPGAGELFSEYRMHDAISGREAQAAIGLRNVWKVHEGVRLSTGLERLTPISSAGQPATAASLGAEFARSLQLKGTSRLEWRREGPGNAWLSTAGIARRLSTDWSMLAKNYYQLAPTPGSRSQLQDRFWMGAAYRDADRNRQNLLSRYEFKFERIPQGAAGSSFGQRRVHVVSTHGDYRRSQPWMVSGQYAGKWVREELEGGIPRYAAHLFSGRAGYDLSRRIDVAGLASTLWSGSDHRMRKAFGAEVGLLVVENTWLSLGYNVTGFSDRDFDDLLNVDSTTRGFFIRLRVKFDEGVLGLR